MAILQRRSGREYFIATRVDACERCDAPFGPNDILHMLDCNTGGVHPLCENCARIMLTPEQFEDRRRHGVHIVCRGCQRMMIGGGVGLYGSRRFSRRYCTQRCYQKAYREQRRRDRPLAICQVCEAAFESSRIDARYCSHACRQRAYRQRGSTVTVQY